MIVVLFYWFRTDQSSPVVLLDEADDVVLHVGFSGDGDGFVHEGLVKIHFVHLQI